MEDTSARTSTQGKQNGSGKGKTFQPQPVKLIPPSSDAKKYNRQAVKEYVFNETGNILLSTTAIGSDKISKEVMDVFAEVSVFFAAMTKAMSTTINPDTKKPYSIYDMDAIRGIIDGSGLFVQVSQEDVHFQHKGASSTFSKELVEGLLALPAGEGELVFADALVSSIGQEGFKISVNSSSSEKQVGTIIFVCEYLLGTPLISAVVSYADIKSNVKTFQAGPCVKGKTESSKLSLKKDTYLFVPPKFIRSYQDDLVSIETDVEYREFVDYLRDLVLQKPSIETVATLDGIDAGGVLEANESYAIAGDFLVQEETKVSDVTVSFDTPSGANAPTLTTGSVEPNIVTFSVESGKTMSDAAPIQIKVGKKVVVKSPEAYTVISNS